MADSGIKKSKIAYLDLPPINTELDGYQLRYRIISEDKNRTSHWSQLHQVVPDFDYQAGSNGIKITSTNNLKVDATWDIVKVNKIVSDKTNFIANQVDFDIFIKWSKSNNGDWLYGGQVTGNSFSSLIPETYLYNSSVVSEKPNQFSAKVFIRSSDPVISKTSLLVYSVDYHTV